MCLTGLYANSPLQRESVMTSPPVQHGGLLHGSSQSSLGGLHIAVLNTMYLIKAILFTMKILHLKLGSLTLERLANLACWCMVTTYLWALEEVKGWLAFYVSGFFGLLVKNVVACDQSSETLSDGSTEERKHSGTKRNDLGIRRSEESDPVGRGHVTVLTAEALQELI